MVKRRIVAIILSILLILSIPITLLAVGFSLPAQFDESYYGELSYQFDRLKNTKGKKIVLIGNSALAFGVRTDLLDNEFADYSVVNFGLYGALGTKLMLDLSKVNIGEGDIVVVVSEPFTQPSSLYFSAKDTWRAVENNGEMLSFIARENTPAMVGNYVSYLQEKFSYFSSGEKPPIEGVYSQSAFLDDGKEVGYMTYERGYNVMTGGYDPTLPIDSPEQTYEKAYLDYLNAYNDYVKEKGATLYFGFAPINSLSVGNGNVLSAHASYLQKNLSFELLGHPEKYLLDYHWFYDNNVHMNSSGMFVYTDLLAEDLKLKLKVMTPNSISIPELPQIPTKPIGGSDNRDADLFTYEIVRGAESFIRLTGLTEEGKNRTEITLPTDYKGIPVREFAKEVFAGNQIVSKITLPSTIGTIYDGSFDGAIRLSELVFKHDSILGLNVGEKFLSGADGCLIYVKKGVSLVNCAGGWEQYQSRVRYY